MKTKPGECYDKRSIPIYPGDLLKSYHFTAALRRKKHYLYHVAVWDTQHETMKLVHVSDMEPTRQGHGGTCWLSQELADNTEIIHGCGPGEILDYYDRPRRAPMVTTTDGRDPEPTIR